MVYPFSTLRLCKRSGSSIGLALLALLLAAPAWSDEQINLPDLTGLSLEQLAYCDNVTPLHNRHYFKEQLEILIDDTVRNDRNSAVLFIDLDSFKKVNDTLGHDAGDELLRQVAIRIQAGGRSNDIACRPGGDEFAIIIRHNATRALVEKLSERLLELIAQPCELYGKRVFATASIGASPCSGRKSAP